MEQKVPNPVEQSICNEERHQHGLETLAALLPGIVHELNNPLTYVMSNLETLSEYLDVLRQGSNLLEQISSSERLPSANWSQQVRSYLTQEDLPSLWSDIDEMMSETIEGLDLLPRSTQSLRNYVQGLSQKNPRTKQLQLNEVVEEAFSLAHNVLKYKCTLSQDYQPIPNIEGATSHLLQVFLNLLLNASLAMEDRGTLQLRTFTQDSWAVVEIQDTGIGFSPQQRIEVTKPYTSFWPNQEQPRKGLGLAIVEQTLKQHGGSFDIQSTQGKGTLTRCYLPITIETHP